MCDKDGKCDLTNLSEYDKKINELKLNDMYYGTSFVCVVYGIVAVSILMASVISPIMKDIFFSEFLVFTIVFIVGSIIIISVLIYYINYYEVKKIKHINLYDTYSCPDYWNMVTLDDNNVYKNFDSNISPNYFKYKCVLNDNIFDKYDIYKSSKDDKIKYETVYNLTNNLDNTTNITNTNIRDSYSETNKYILEANIKNSNIGHLYKNINDINVFKSDKDNLNSNSFAYIRPGDKLTSEYLSNIKDKIINTSLIMNNYQYNDIDSSYSNIIYKSYSDKIDPYISWNYSNVDYTSTKTNGRSIDQETYDIYDWKGRDNNLTYDMYISYFTRTSKTQLDVYVLNSSSSYINIGTLNKDNDNIYFTSIINTTAANLLYINNFNATYNISITDTFINTTKNTPPVANTLTDKGPTIIINISLGRPQRIYNSNIYANSCNIPVVCDSIYPAYLASVEDTNLYGADNAIRCSYAKLCGYSWSDMGCN